MRQQIALAIVCIVLLLGLSVSTHAQNVLPAPGCSGSTVDNLGADFAKNSRAFLAELQSAVSTGDKNKVAAMISYPLLFIHGDARMRIKTKTAFLAQYDTVFNGHVRQAIAQQSAKCLFGNYQGAMVGNGEVWFSEQPDKRMKIITVNATAAAQPQ